MNPQRRAIVGSRTRGTPQALRASQDGMHVMAFDTVAVDAQRPDGVGAGAAIGLDGGGWDGRSSASGSSARLRTGRGVRVALPRPAIVERPFPRVCELSTVGRDAAQHVTVAGRRLHRTTARAFRSGSDPGQPGGSAWKHDGGESGQPWAEERAQQLEPAGSLWCGGTDDGRRVRPWHCRREVRPFGALAAQDHPLEAAVCVSGLVGAW
jgi:hypothetical protein